MIYLSSTFGGKPKIYTNSILELNFQGNPAEKSTDLNPILELLGEKPTVSFSETLELLESACNDKQIKAISIDGSSRLDHTKTMELADALREFKNNCDKKIYAYGDLYSQSGYLLSSQADSTFLHPMGNVNLVGYQAILTYFKDFLDRWDIDIEIYKAGKFKSYTETFTEKAASPENQQQYMELLESMHLELVESLTKWNGKDKDFWSSVIQEDKGARAQNALDIGLIDKLSYEVNYKDHLLSSYDEDNSGFISLATYKSSRSASAKKANVALVVMEGGIAMEGEEISSKVLKKELKKIRKSDQYKAVVLRVNSGGGSSFASDDIWHEIELLKEKGLPVIASIGNVAASGGYYVLMNSDKIFAQQNSIVGSIGVFIMVPQLNEALEKHVGINFSEFKTSEFSSNVSILTDLTPAMEKKFQNETDFIYETFVTKVSTSRNIPIDKAYEYAQGRIYAGARSKEIGLIDDIKSYSEVLNYIKDTYQLDYIKTHEYPEPTGAFVPPDITSMIQTMQRTKNIHNFASEAVNSSNELIKNSLNLEPRMEWIEVTIK